MDSFTFDIEIQLNKNITDDELGKLIDELYDQGCTDALVMLNEGNKLSVCFDRKGESFRSSLAKAKTSVKAALANLNIKAKLHIYA